MGKESCRLCHTTTSGQKNDTFYELLNLVVSATCDRSQKVNYLMRAASIAIQSSDGCATDFKHVKESIAATKNIFRRIEELMEQQNE